jgi:E3 ubiquitin-protein ligase NRDP1
MKLSKSNSFVKSGSINNGSSGNIPLAEKSTSTSLVWDPAKTGGGITITENGTQCFLKEQSYLFRTTLANQGFTSGVHYWEILADARTENELKIGVTSNKDFDYNSAFCDHSFGFAYYGTSLIS